jgi:GTP-binding protein HflX
VVVSATTGEGLDELRERIGAELGRSLREVDLLVPYAEGSRVAELHTLAGDLVRQDTDEGVHVHARLPAAVADRYSRFAVDGRDGDGYGAGIGSDNGSDIEPGPGSDNGSRSAR